MREGSLEAPTRHPVDWQSPEFHDESALDAETRRVFDICHGCRRCFNLCDSFPRLFDMVDASPTEELDSVASDQFGPVIDACTLCDMCFMTKCPYVPPHEFNLDFPHLMLRHRAVVEKYAPKGLPDAPSAEAGAIGELERSAVIDALSRLPARQREALVLRYYADLSEAEIANAMGISRGAVKSHTARGMTALRNVLEQFS